ncbi:MAG: hypothetical protein MZW92_22025 [Comamonadaceae bacterium]|nr:hypothetical protein [Comamonadaceae bacterium]
MNIEITAPETLRRRPDRATCPSRRGQITGTEPRGIDTMAITGQVPLAELSDYQSRLRSMTGGHGSYTIEFSHHAPVPPQTQQQLMSQFKRAADED